MQLKTLHILLLLLLAGSLQAQMMEKFSGTGTVLKNDLAYYQNEVVIHEKSGARDKVIDALVNLGTYYMQSHDYTNAIPCFKRLIVLYQEANNHSAMADMMINICDAYRALSDFPHLLEYLQEATKEYTKAGNENGLAKTLRSTGYYYLNLSLNRLPAIPYFQQSLALYRKLGIQKEESYLLIEIGHAYMLSQDTVQGLPYLQQAFSLCQKIGNKRGMANYYGIMGDYYFRMQVNIPKALDCFQKSLSLYEEDKNRIGVAQVSLTLSDLYVYSPDTALINAGIPPSEKYTLAIESAKRVTRFLKKFCRNQSGPGRWVLSGRRMKKRKISIVPFTIIRCI